MPGAARQAGMVTSGILPSRDTRTSMYIVGFIAGGREKVRPGTGREAGLGHAGSDVKKILCGNKDQVRSC